MANKYQQRRRQLRQTQSDKNNPYESGSEWASDAFSIGPPMAAVELPPAGPVKYAIAFALLLAVWMIYSQTAQHDFIVCDDNVYVYENPEILQGLTRPLTGPDGLFSRNSSPWLRWEGFSWAFRDSHAGNWHPLTWLTHMIDWQIYGHWKPEEQRYVNSWPGGHHLSNMLIHALNAVILFFAMRKLTGAQWASAAVAMLFAVHPLRAESVAWAAERKDVLCGFFWMLTLLCYANYARRPSIAWYLAVSAMLFCGLMAKSMIVTLPCVLFLLDFWPLNRVTGSYTPEEDEKSALAQIGWLALEKLPWLAVVLGVSYVTILGQDKGVALNPFDALPLWMRLVNMSLAYVAYLGQSFWPTHMAPFYTHLGMIPPVDATKGNSLDVFSDAFFKSGPVHSMTPDVILNACLAAVFLLAVTGLVLTFARRNGWAAVGWLWFLGSLIPVIGILQVGTQARADRYTYLPTIGIAIMLVWGIRAVVDWLPELRKILGLCVALAAACLIFLAWVQVSYWKTSYTLFEHAVQVTERNFFAYNHLGIAFDKDFKDSTYTLTARHRAEFDHYGIPYDKKNTDENLPITFEQHRALADKSRDNFAATIAIKPNYDFGNNNLGVYYANKGDIPHAEKYFEQALRCNRRYADVYANLGVLYRMQGRLQESLAMHLEGLKVRQDKASDFNNTAQTYFDLGDDVDAIKMLNLALAQDPSYSPSYCMLAEIDFKNKNLTEAEDHLSRAVTIEPKILTEWGKWVLAVAHKGDFALAQSAAEFAQKSAPKFPIVYDILAEIASQQKKYDEAINQLTKAVEIDRGNPLRLHSIGRMQELKGDLGKAVQAMQASLAVDPKFLPAHISLAEIYINAQQFDEAIKHLSIAASLERGNPTTLQLLVKAFLGKGDIANAANIAQNIERSAPNVSLGHLLMGNVLEHEGKLDEAIAEYHITTKLEPKASAFHHLLGMALWAKGNRSEAIKETEEAVRLAPNDTEEAAKLARMRKEAGVGP